MKSAYDVATFNAPDIATDESYSIDVGSNHHVMLIDLMTRCRSLVEFEVALMAMSKARYLPDNLGENETVNAYRQIGEAVGLSQMAVEAIVRRLVPWAL